MHIEHGIYHDMISLGSHEVDPFNAALPTCYFQIMQEAAGAHAFHRGVSIPHLQRMDKTWVVTRTRMRLLAHASWPGTIRVETWPQNPWKLYFPRVCKAWDADGQELFESLSHWVVMDLTSQRPVKPQQVATMFGPSAIGRDLDPDLGRRVSFPQEACRKFITYEPRILYSDIDLNRHVNNVVYLQWMLDSLPFSFRDTHVAREIDISYLAQTFGDDRIIVRTGLMEEELLAQGEALLFHEITKIHSDGTSEPVCVAKTSWSERIQ